MIIYLKQMLRTATVIVFLVGGVTSCIKEEDTGADLNLPTRTVLVYLAGDNNLADLARIPELLRQGWKYTGSRCLVYYDGQNSTPVLLSLRGGCESYPISFIETVAEYPEENSASADVFSRVVRDVAAMYPADSYGLIFTSHASGWLPEGTLATPQRDTRSIGSDMSSGTLAQGNTEMELADFADAIPDGHFDFIIFEACLMAGVEVAYELRNKTDYVLASSAELLAPGFIPVYSRMSPKLFDTSISIESSLKEFASEYFDYINTKSGVYRSTTLSIIRTEELDALAALVTETYPKADSIESSDISGLQHFDRPGSYGDASALPRYFDLGDYMQSISTRALYDRFEKLMDRIVVWKAATPMFMENYNGFKIICHSGLTIYIPQTELPFLNEAYRKTAWGKRLQM